MKSVTLLRRMMVTPTTIPLRSFSASALNIKSKFEQAYQAKMENLSKVPPKV
jgi:hypothetical protein